MDKRALPEIDESTTQRLVALFSSNPYAGLIGAGIGALGGYFG